MTVLEQAQEFARANGCPALIVKSYVLHDHEELYSWVAEPALSTLYPEHLREYWAVVGKVWPNGEFNDYGDREVNSGRVSK